jgi:hypothetical protein
MKMWFRLLTCLIILAGVIALMASCIYHDPLTDPVVKADLIVLGTVTGIESRIEIYMPPSDNVTKISLAYEYFRLSVEKVIKGDPAIKEVSIKGSASPLDDRGIRMPTELVFEAGDRPLVILTHKEGTTYSLVQPGGIAWIERKGMVGVGVDTELQYRLGRIIKIMLIKHVPITLPRSEWPPLPTSSPNVPPLPKGLPQ